MLVAPRRIDLRAISRVVVVTLIIVSIVIPTILQPLKVLLLAVVVFAMLLDRGTWASQSQIAQTAIDGLALALSFVGLI